MSNRLSFKAKNGIRAIKGWAIPYLSSCMRPGEFRPVLAYLFTDWQCNIDCHYCFQNDRDRPGMTLETALSAVDWLKSLGCRVLALMGGEPLIRKDFILEVIRYGAQNDFFVYLPTNGYLLDEKFIDDMGAAGVAAVNLAVDAVAPRRGLPKALLAIEPQFRYLVKCAEKYGYLVFLNINICRTNLKDVKLLTEIAHQNQIGTDYHLNEAPHAFVDTGHFQHRNHDLYITPDQNEEVDELLDWLIAKQRSGWPMVNPIAHLEEFKARQRGHIPPWSCRAGQNGCLIKTDGSLAPCFDLITYKHDWGRIWKPKMDEKELNQVKQSCMPLCSSTCFYTMAYYYTLQGARTWVRKHMRVG